MSKKVEGKIVVTSSEELTPEQILKIEQVLNGELVNQPLYDEFKAAIRVHLG